MQLVMGEPLPRFLLLLIFPRTFFARVFSMAHRAHTHVYTQYATNTFLTDIFLCTRHSHIFSILIRPATICSTILAHSSSPACLLWSSIQHASFIISMFSVAKLFVSFFVTSIYFFRRPAPPLPLYIIYYIIVQTTSATLAIIYYISYIS